MPFKKKFSPIKVVTKGISPLKVTHKLGAIGLKPSMPNLNHIIKAEIIGSGLKVGSGFQKALEGYIDFHKIKGKRADTVKAYVTSAAIKIVLGGKGKYSFGKKSKEVKPSDVQAAIYWLHPPPVSMDDPCEAATNEIVSMEKNRPKGKVGKLSPAIIDYLDKLKA